MKIRSYLKNIAAFILSFIVIVFLMEASDIRGGIEAIIIISALISFGNILVGICQKGRRDERIVVLASLYFLLFTLAAMILLFGYEIQDFFDDEYAIESLLILIFPSISIITGWWFYRIYTKFDNRQ